MCYAHEDDSLVARTPHRMMNSLRSCASLRQATACIPSCSRKACSFALAGHSRFFFLCAGGGYPPFVTVRRSEETTSELQSLLRNSSAVFCLTTHPTYPHTLSNPHLHCR